MEINDLLRSLQLEELYLLHHNHSENPERLQDMLAKNFYEVAANGQIVERQQVVDWLMAKDSTARWDMSDFGGEQLTPSLALLVYSAKQVHEIPQESKGSRRSSLWRKPRGSEQWQLVFHQATQIQ